MLAYFPSAIVFGSAWGSGLGSGICARLGSESSSTHLGSELYSELALVRLSSGLELDSAGGGKKCLSTDESLVNPHGQSSRSQNVVFDTICMGSQRDTICFHRNGSEPLKLLLSVLGSEFGSAWLGARPGWAPDRCSAWLRARFASRLEGSTRGLDSTWLEARLGLLKTQISSRLGSARYSRFGLTRLWIGLDLGLTRGWKNQLNARLSWARGSVRC